MIAETRFTHPALGPLPNPPPLCGGGNQSLSPACGGRPGWGQATETALCERLPFLLKSLRQLENILTRLPKNRIENPGDAFHAAIGSAGGVGAG